MNRVIRPLGPIVALFFVLAFNSAQTQAQVREVPANINDIAIVRYDAYGPIIYYNPNYVAAVGPLVWQFVRTHEYGHIVNQTSDERAADCYATQMLMHTNPSAVEAFIQFKASQGTGGGDLTHLPGILRARWIDDCRRGLHRH